LIDEHLAKVRHVAALHSATSGTKTVVVIGLLVEERPPVVVRPLVELFSELMVPVDVTVVTDVALVVVIVAADVVVDVADAVVDVADIADVVVADVVVNPDIVVVVVVDSDVVPFSSQANFGVTTHL
jgi:hypothetical protein